MTIYEDYLHKQMQREWKMSEDVPFFEAGEPMDVRPYHHLDYLDYYAKLQGAPYGGNGIGRLREVGLVRVTDDDLSPYWSQSPEYFSYLHLAQRDGLGLPDADRMYEQQENYAKLLLEQGLTIHWIDKPPKVGPFGPLGPTAGAAAGLVVVRGGTIIGKMATELLSTGRNYWYARWAFSELGISPLLTLHGTAVAEMGANIWLADDVYVTALSASFNAEGLRQFSPVIQASSKNPIHIQVMQLPNRHYFDPRTGCCSHPDVVIGPLDVGKVIVYPPSIDFATMEWLRDQHYDVVEVEVDEQVKYFPCNVTIIEPGKVMMTAGANNAIAAVRKLGVEVIEVPFDEFVKVGGGMDCATSKIRRDPGPSTKD